MSRVELLKEEGQQPAPYGLDKNRIEKLWVDTSNELNNLAYSIRDNGKMEFDSKDTATATNATQSLYAVIEYDASRDNRWRKKEKRPEFDEVAINLIEKYRVCQVKFGYMKREGDRNNRRYSQKSTLDGNNPNNIKTYQVRWDNNENILKGYVESNLDNIALREKECVQKFYYYKYKTEKMARDKGYNFDLYWEVQNRGQVIVAEEFFGSGAKCTEKNLNDKQEFNKNDTDKIISFRKFIADFKNSKKESYTRTKDPRPKLGEADKVEVEVLCESSPINDIYDDRITVLSYNSATERIIIKEFNRANVDISVKFWVNYFNGWGDERKNPSKSTLENIFDFIVGKFSVFPADKSLYLFHYNEELVDNIIAGKINGKILNDDIKLPYADNYSSDPNKRLICKDLKEYAQKFKTIYKENKGGDEKSYRYLLLNELVKMRSTKNIDHQHKENVLAHRGGTGYNSSQGCLTICTTDYVSNQMNSITQFEELFDYGKCGRLFLFREKLTEV